jgi:FAD/FMN-containing dehydrogenase
MIDASSSAPAFFRGVWLEPDHADYDAACSTFNRRATPRPAVIARCAGTADVVAAVAHARERGLRIAVRATGLTLGTPPEDTGLIVDLSLMRGVQILPDARIARIQGGVTGGDLQIESAAHGLAAPSGAMAGTGVGMMLGGGIGHLLPRIGYVSDNIVAVELVTASAEVVRATPDANPDLFWAVRGSAGSFGVVTALELKLYDVPPLVHAGSMSWTLANVGRAVELLRSLWDWAPDELNVIGMASSASFEGVGGLDLYLCHSGSEEQARADLRRLRAVGGPDAEEISALPFRDVHFLLEGSFPSMRVTSNEVAVSALTDALLETLLANLALPAGGGAHDVEINLGRGALTRAPQRPSALRETAAEPTWSLAPTAWWEDAAEDDLHAQWVRETTAEIRKVGPTVDRLHPNMIGADLDPEGVAALYGDRYERLRSLKRRWDPDNVFRGSHNIPPADHHDFTRHHSGD